MAFSAAFFIAVPINSLVPRWEGCAFTITGFPAASADAVSPPAVEKAKGKITCAKYSYRTNRQIHFAQIIAW